MESILTIKIEACNVMARLGRKDFAKVFPNGRNLSSFFHQKFFPSNIVWNWQFFHVSIK